MHQVNRIGQREKSHLKHRNGNSFHRTLPAKTLTLSSPRNKVTDGPEGAEPYASQNKEEQSLPAGAFSEAKLAS